MCKSLYTSMCTNVHSEQEVTVLGDWTVYAQLWLCRVHLPLETINMILMFYLFTCLLIYLHTISFDLL